MTAKKSRKMTLAEENRLRKKLGFAPRKRITRATLKAEWKKKAKALPKEQRQRILDMLWSRITYGEIASREGVDMETIFGVRELNTYAVTYLNTETV